MGTPDAADLWGVGEAYERYIGRWSRPVAAAFVDWLAVPVGADWLDVGCGTGALTGTILDRADPRSVLGVDPSPGFLATARARLRDPRATFIEGDARDLPAPSGVFDAAVSGLVLNFVPDPARAVAELARAARSGAVVAVYVWGYPRGIDLIRRFWDAAIAVDPAAADLEEGRRYAHICRPGALAALFAGAGLAAVETRAIDVPTVFRDFDDYWAPFLGKQGPAPAYAARLPADRLVAIRERLRTSLPYAAHETIPLTARAWAVRGRRIEAAAGA